MIFTRTFNLKLQLLTLGIRGFWLLIKLPYHWQMTLGRWLGSLFYYAGRRRRRIAEINIALCFPELSPAEQQKQVYKHFQSLGMGLFEHFYAWGAAERDIQRMTEIVGFQHFVTAREQGKGIIMLSAHLNSLEIGGRVLTSLCQDVHAVYRPHENPVMESLFQDARMKWAEKAIPRENVRDMVRALKAKKLLWFAIDQNFGHKNSVFAEFFGIPAATNTSVARLAEMSNAIIVPFFTKRIQEDNTNRIYYKVIFMPHLINFPTGNNYQDACTVNQLIEQIVRDVPEQYLWVHRRFKDRPNDEPRFY